MRFSREKRELLASASSSSVDIVEDVTPKRKFFSRRNIVFLILGTVVGLFLVIFLPVYLTKRAHKKYEESSGELVGRGSTTPPAFPCTAGAVWSQKSDFKDLSDLRILYYSSGVFNSKVLPSLPSNATSSTAPSSNATSTASSSNATSNAISTSPSGSGTSPGGSVLQIFYPAHSYTPSARPVGGTQFYALTPFNLALASSVTLNYSVYFPPGYNFVIGGKLPGLYGGAEGCGGGNKAQNCWSTRMAWRRNGMGELYAYLPQAEQNLTGMLKVPPYSYVNADYGISLGRGALNYTAGGWTGISQTVTLSTNSTKPNGVVEIKVNGRRAIYFDQVFWPAGIKGILFSTFFGGATTAWATPRDQYSYFKGFSVTINSLIGQ